MAGSKLMIARDKISRGLALAFAAMLMCCPPPARAQSGIGSTAIAKNDVHGVRGTVTRPLAVGGAVYSDDSVKTGDASLAQLLFIDQTTFSIAANSEAILKNVYRPKTGGGQLVLNALSGAFRYVSGVQGGVGTRINFPFGYLTVRGTIVDILVWPDHTVIILDEGAITVVPYATRIAYNMDQPGKYIIVYRDGHVDGPMTWDSTIMRIAGGNTPFPLYGRVIYPMMPNASNQTLEAFQQQTDINFLLNGNVSSNGFGACPAGQIATSGGCIPNPLTTLTSDVRLKRDIVLLKHLDNGLDLYRYRYLWSDTLYVGVMAQQVEKLYPDAVAPLPNGYLGVRYDRLGMQLMTWDQWLASPKQ
jgi:hypothetical protein